jgi:hypothetical protein
MRRLLPHRKISGSIFCALVIAVVISAIYIRLTYRDARSFYVQISMRSSVSDKAQIYYNTGENLSERHSVSINVVSDEQFQTHNFALPGKTIYNLRFDPPAGAISIQSISIVNGFGKSLEYVDLNVLRPANQIKVFDLKNNTLDVTADEGANDPQISVPLSFPLKLDDFFYYTAIPSAGRLLGGVLIISLASFFLIWILRKRSIMLDFFDHPVKVSYGWIRENRLFFSVILCLLAFRVFFALTYPLNTCGDGGAYYRLMRSDTSTLVHAMGYPYFMHFFLALLPTKTDVLVFQHFIDFGIQLLLMLLLKKRFGLVAAITAGLFYGLELRTINWVSRSTPEWLQGVFFALAFVGAMEAYLTKKPAKKVALYLFSSWAFAMTVLVKFLTVVMLPLYFILFILEKRKWTGKWLCFAAMGIIIFVQMSLFVYLYHYPSTGTKALTHDVAWILDPKISYFLPNGHHLSESGPWSKRYCILISEMPLNLPEGVPDRGLYGLFSHVDSYPQAIRKPYRERYRELSSKSDSELQSIINEKQNLRGLDSVFLSSIFLGLSETDSLLEKVFIESAIRYPKEYLLHVFKGVKESFFIQPSYYIAIVSNPFASDPDHPFQLNKDDIIQNLPWGYALYNVSANIRCMYDEPIFLKSGLHFFSSWGEQVNIPVIFKWFLIILGTVVACIGFKKDKRFGIDIIYLLLGTTILLLFTLLSNLIFVFRDKEFDAFQHLFCLLIGISVSSIVSLGKLLWLEGFATTSIDQGR